MLQSKSKTIPAVISYCLMALWLSPTLSQAETNLIVAAADTGSTAARQAKEQREALAKKKAELEAQKASEAKTPATGATPSTTGSQPKDK
jgi:hypothetical protein